MQQPTNNQIYQHGAFNTLNASLDLIPGGNMLGNVVVNRDLSLSGVKAVRSPLRSDVLLLASSSLSTTLESPSSICFRRRATTNVLR